MWKRLAQDPQPHVPTPSSASWDSRVTPGAPLSLPDVQVLSWRPRPTAGGHGPRDHDEQTE